MFSIFAALKIWKINPRTWLNVTSLICPQSTPFQPESLSKIQPVPLNVAHFVPHLQRVFTVQILNAPALSRRPKKNAGINDAGVLRAG
jgi:hypothetical protein